MKNNPSVIGITGGIGSGKSTVCKVFESLGAITYYADDRAKWLMASDRQLINQIKDLFGEEAYNKNGLDREYIAGVAFKDKIVLEKLNKLVHPAVARDIKSWADEHSKAPLLLKEAALLFETGSYKELDKTILVTAPEKLRIKRVVDRDPHRSEEDVQLIIDKQMSEEEKIPLADFVITNDGSRSVIKQVMDIYALLIA